MQVLSDSYRKRGGGGGGGKGGKKGELESCEKGAILAQNGGLDPFPSHDSCFKVRFFETCVLMGFSNPYRKAPSSAR